METTDESKWREYIKDNNNFSQQVPFNFKSIYSKLEIASKNPDKLNPFYTLSAIYDFTKFFYHISTALSMGFSDITTKAEQMRTKFEEYPDSTDISFIFGYLSTIIDHKGLFSPPIFIYDSLLPINFFCFLKDEVHLNKHP